MCDKMRNLIRQILSFLFPRCNSYTPTLERSIFHLKRYVEQTNQTYRDWHGVPAMNGERTTLTSREPENIRKNRYSNILPYDQTLVRLNSGGYINANYVYTYLDVNSDSHLKTTTKKVLPSNSSSPTESNSPTQTPQTKNITTSSRQPTETSPIKTSPIQTSPIQTSRTPTSPKNANSPKKHEKHVQYICTQGPMTKSAKNDGTIGDFWEMIIQEKSKLVVMVTQLMQGNRLKCSQYWPENGETITFQSGIGEIIVETIQEEVREDGAFIWREFKVSYLDEKSRGVKVSADVSAQNSGEINEEFKEIEEIEKNKSARNDQRVNLEEIYETEFIDPELEAKYVSETIQHLQYVTWPDHGVPGKMSDFLEFVSTLAQIRAETDLTEKIQRPVTIHCSAGVGRTGVTILVETAMKQANMNMPIDFKASFIQLRAQRTLMVQMIQQYEFSIRAFLNWYGSNYED